MNLRAEHQREVVTCQLIANGRKIQLVGSAYQIIRTQQVRLIIELFQFIIGQRSFVETIVVDPKYRNIFKYRSTVGHIQKHIVAVFQHLGLEGEHHQLLVATRVTEKQSFFASICRIGIGARNIGVGNGPSFGESFGSDVRRRCRGALARCQGGRCDLCHDDVIEVVFRCRGNRPNRKHTVLGGGCIRILYHSIRNLIRTRLSHPSIFVFDCDFTGTIRNRC